MRLLHHHPFADFCRRLVAAGSAALVLLLTALTVAPELHQRLHVGDDALHDDGCAVVLFAGGVSLAVDTAALSAPAAVWLAQAQAFAADIFLASPRYLHQPERGPPVG